MEAKLVVVGGEAHAGEYQLSLPTVIGRSRKADLKLGHPLVSRQHCELFESNDALMVRDLGSLNGTFVGGSRIAGETHLQPGDLLTVGSVTFRAVYGGVSDFPAGESAPAKAGAPHRPVEVEQTAHAGGLADLEQLKESEAARSQQAPAAPDENFDLGWLDEDAEDMPLPEIEPKTSQAPPANRAKPNKAEEEAELDVEPLEELELEFDEPAAIKPAKPAVAKTSPIPPEETQTMGLDESRAAKRKPAAQPDKSAASEPQVDDEDFDEFFKNIE